MVQRRSHRVRPVGLRVPCVMWRSMATNRMACSAKLLVGSTPVAGGQEAREIHEKDGLPFIEVYFEAALEVCEERDPKGLYKKARAGEIKEFTGISAPYEAPNNAELTINTGDCSPQEAAIGILSYLEEKGMVRLTDE